MTVLEPGALRCVDRRDGRKECRFEDRTQPSIQTLHLDQHDDRRWSFRLEGGAPPPNAERLYLRIGDDWAGVDRSTDELIVSLRPSLDTSRQVQKLIGVDGGTLETTDAAGVAIRLTIPAGALTRETAITITPVLGSTLVAPGLRAGVKLEPAGLQFADPDGFGRPATLTLDFSATGQAIGDGDFTFLLTSPLTAVPVFGSVDPVARTMTARLRHFSELGSGAGSAAMSDLAAWAAAVLAGSGNLTMAELESLAELAAVQQQSGCAGNCLDVGQLAQRAAESIAALAAGSCAATVASASDQILTSWLEVEALAQRFGVDVPAVRQCIGRVIEALIDRATQEANANPSDATFGRLADRAVLAEQLGFQDLATLARERMALRLRAVLDAGVALCESDEARGREALELVARWATAVGGGLVAEVESALAACGARGSPPSSARATPIIRVSSALTQSWACTEGQACVLTDDIQATQELTGPFTATATAGSSTSSISTTITRDPATGSFVASSGAGSIRASTECFGARFVEGVAVSGSNLWFEITGGSYAYSLSGTFQRIPDERGENPSVGFLLHGPNTHIGIRSTDTTIARTGVLGPGTYFLGSGAGATPKCWGATGTFTIAGGFSFNFTLTPAPGVTP